ncbi:conserved hypothetical protein [gamma proteobacterium NOR5-3]|nr:conserved hypothetical protein [gamma proteobacterium NOR5-3]
MTAQIADVLIAGNDRMQLFTNPLEMFFEKMGTRPDFTLPSTANWRGYVATWDLTDGRLYLRSISGRLKDTTACSVASIFPGFPDRVFAHWFSGELRVPIGRVLSYMHMGYGSQYEAYRLVKIHLGVVTADQAMSNDEYQNRDVV